MSSIDAIINRQLMRWEMERRRTSEEPHPAPAEPHHIITISRQTGSRGSYLASLVADRLGFQKLHRDVIDVMSRESGYLRRLVEALDEHTRNRIQMAFDAAFTGQMFDRTDYNQSLYRVVLSMAELGGVVLMGRGGNFILGPSKGLHIRIVCPEPQRIENLRRYKGLSEFDAKHSIERSDRMRREFIAKQFHKNIDNPTNYDLVLNSCQIGMEQLVNIVVASYQAKMDHLRAEPSTH